MLLFLLVLFVVGGGIKDDIGGHIDDGGNVEDLQGHFRELLPGPPEDKQLLMPVWSLRIRVVSIKHLKPSSKVTSLAPNTRNWASPPYGSCSPLRVCFRCS